MDPGGAQAKAASASDDEGVRARALLLEGEVRGSKLSASRMREVRRAVSGVKNLEAGDRYRPWPAWAWPGSSLARSALRWPPTTPSPARARNVTLRTGRRDRGLPSGPSPRSPPTPRRSREAPAHGSRGACHTGRVAGDGAGCDGVAVTPRRRISRSSSFAEAADREAFDRGRRSAVAAIAIGAAGAALAPIVARPRPSHGADDLDGWLAASARLRDRVEALDTATSPRASSTTPSGLEGAIRGGKERDS